MEVHSRIFDRYDVAIQNVVLLGHVVQQLATIFVYHENLPIISCGLLESLEEISPLFFYDRGPHPANIDIALEAVSVLMSSEIRTATMVSNIAA